MKKRRSYTLKVRGDHMAETRRRIAHAAMELHGEVGPRHTTIAAIARRAGVERLTVYRHFPDDDALYTACSARFLELHPPPDPAAWRDLPDPRESARQALGSLYAWFTRTGAMLRRLHRDADEIAPLGRVMAPFEASLAAMAAGLAARLAPRHRTLAVVLDHAMRFATWDSLDGAGVDDRTKVRLMLSWIDALHAER